MRKKREKMILGLILLTGSFFHNSVEAQSEIALDAATRSSYRYGATALIAFSSDDNVSGGSYKLKSTDSPDADLDIYKYIGEIPLVNRDSKVVPFLIFNPSYLSLEQKDPSLSIEIDSWAIGAGMGVQLFFLDNLLEITPRFKLEYSEVDFDLRSSDDTIVVPNGILPNINSLTSLPSIEGVLREEITADGAVINFSSEVTYVYTDASTSNSNVSDFSEQSWIFENILTFEQPVAVESIPGGLLLRPGFGRLDIHGAARNGFDFDHFYEMSFDVLSPDLLSDYLKDVGIGATYVYAKEIQGWRFGLFGKLY